MSSFVSSSDVALRFNLAASRGSQRRGSLLGRHADTAILYGKCKGYLLIGFINQLSADHNLSALGELYRVVGKIEKDLAEPQWVADQGQRNIR